METSRRAWRPPQRAVAAGAALVFAGFLFSDAIRHSVLLLFASFLFAVVLDYPVRLVARVVRRSIRAWSAFGLPARSDSSLAPLARSIAAAIVFFVIAGGLAAAVRFTVPIITEQSGRVAEQAPGSLDRLERWWNRLRHSASVEAAPSGEEIEIGVKSTLRARAGDLARTAVPVAGSVFAAISTLILVLVIATFMVASPETYADGIVRMMPAAQEKPTREFLDRMVRIMRGWMTAQLISMTFVGILTAIGLLAMGVKGWLVLALVNFLCEFVPFLGPFAGAVPGVAVAFAESSRTGLYVLLLYAAIQQLEGYLISPLAMRHEIRLAPPVLLGWQLLMATAFGLPGILLATPILALVKVSIDFFWVEQALGKTPEPHPAD